MRRARRPHPNAVAPAAIIVCTFVIPSVPAFTAAANIVAAHWQVGRSQLRSLGVKELPEVTAGGEEFMPKKRLLVDKKPPT